MDFFEAAALLDKGKIAPVYLCYGEEAYLRRQFLQKLKSVFLSPEMLSCNVEELDGETASLSEILAAAGTLPLLGERKLVVVKGGQLFQKKKNKNGKAETDDDREKEPGAEQQNRRENEDDWHGRLISEEKQVKTDTDALAGYLENPPLSTCLVFAAGDKVDRSTRAYRLLEKKGNVVVCDPMKGQQLANWAQTRFKEAGKQADRSVIAYLIGAVSDDLFSLASEIDKLVNYAGNENRITMDAVKAVGSRTTRESIFSLTDSLGNGESEKAVRVLRDLLAFGEPPIRILAMISRQFRLLLTAREYLNLGCSQAEAAQKLGGHPYAARKSTEQARRFTLGELHQALKYCLWADAGIKKGRLESVTALELLVARLCTLKQGFR